MNVMLARLTNPFRAIVGSVGEAFRAIPRFLKEVWGELQRVVWPSHDDTYAFTGVVVVAVAIVAAWVGLLDFIFTKVVSALGLYH